MTKVDQIAERLRVFVAQDLVAEGIALEATTALSSVGVDSAALLEILLFVERHYDVMVPESDLTRANLQNVTTLARCVHGHLSSGQAAS